MEVAHPDDATEAEAIALRFVRWLDSKLLAAGRGDDTRELDHDPATAFWLGTLASEEAVANSKLGERGERLDPCALGIRIRPSEPGPWSLEASTCVRAWLHQGKSTRPLWQKSEPIQAVIRCRIPSEPGTYAFGAEALNAEFARQDLAPLSAELRVEVEVEASAGLHLDVTLVNTSPEKSGALKDTTLYECQLGVSGIDLTPFELDALPDSFRYDRRILAYGINCGVTEFGDTLQTADTTVVERKRLDYSIPAHPAALAFDALGTNPLDAIDGLVSSYEKWGSDAWSDATLSQRRSAERWTEAMHAEAISGRADHERELARLRAGAELLRNNPLLRRAFMLMNTAMAHAAHGRYPGWRPFQIAFMLIQLPSLVDVTEASYVDVLWFPTGGGKTETYLGLLVTGALYDRLRGKKSGVSAWSRFPLRMLSLQQTQRFADALAGAELARQHAGIGGDPISLGFFVGESSTPNSILVDPPEGAPNPDDPSMPARFQVLLRCPFCASTSMEMGFDRRLWRLEHRCSNRACPWTERALPFFTVDQEIYRFLPTVVVGTLDKAASIAMQAAMRGFIGAPAGVCSAEGHGFTYARRRNSPTGCLVPGCQRSALKLSAPPESWPPTFRLQDELHLLRDSLGAVDSHYESLFDHLQQAAGGRRPKIVASSATLTGFDRQAVTLYGRTGRVFPSLPPRAEGGFWSRASAQVARRFVAIAPRGSTMEYAVDRTLTLLQTEIRRLQSEPAVVCAEAGVPTESADFLLSLYGTDVVYGNTIRDLEGVVRSVDTQVPVSPLRTAQLTGRTPFAEVRSTLDRLEQPEPVFDERLHVVAASNMMSHGVDIDRINVMVMMGIPLTTAEFIQTTARVGRRWPGLVIVMHRMARERDAATYRFFRPFVEQGDRFIEPIPITRRSRRVLTRTLAGLFLARILALHEPAAGRSLTTVRTLREYASQTDSLTRTTEGAALIQALDFGGPAEDLLRGDLASWVELFFEALEDVGSSVRFPSELSPTGPPMRSLRDVERTAPIQDVRS